MIRKALLAFSLLSLSIWLPASEQKTSDFMNMSLDELINVDISLATRKEEKLFNVPFAAYVMTSEDIRRSGATTVIEALRLVPGLNAAQINAHSWAIFNRTLTKHQLGNQRKQRKYNHELCGYYGGGVG